ncbi:MAG TPA: GYD domain-containing protein [Rubrobacteraceae bacterium]|nr:GYD domain-containing protein [Rubrobacteraceae bacterium]
MVGSVVSLHYSFGDYDGVIMLEAPDEKAAASMVLAAVSAGHLESIKTTTLLTVEDAMEVFRRAKRSTGGRDGSS